MNGGYTKFSDYCKINVSNRKLGQDFIKITFENAFEVPPVPFWRNLNI